MTKPTESLTEFDRLWSPLGNRARIARNADHKGITLTALSVHLQITVPEIVLRLIIYDDKHKTKGKPRRVVDKFLEHSRAEIDAMLNMPKPTDEQLKANDPIYAKDIGADGACKRRFAWRMKGDDMQLIVFYVDNHGVTQPLSFLISKKKGMWETLTRFLRFLRPPAR